MTIGDFAWIAPAGILLFVWLANRNARAARRRRSRRPAQPRPTPYQAKNLTVNTAREAPAKRTAKRAAVASSGRVSKSARGERRRIPLKENPKKQDQEASRATGVSAISGDRSLRPDHSSYSQIDTFEQCPKKYWFRYIANETASFDSIEATGGTVIHKAIEWAYHQRDSKSLPAKAAVLRQFLELWRTDIEDAEVRVVRSSRTIADYEVELRDALAAFYSRVLRSDTTETIAMEHPITLDLGGLEYRGFADRVARDSQGIFVIDYKTTRRPGQEKAHMTQLRSYGAAIMAQHEVADIGLSNEYIVQRTNHAARFALAEVPTFKRQLQRRARATKTAASYPATASPLCHWCPYQDKCDEFRSSWVARIRM